MSGRQRAIRQWMCPNHPDGPRTLPADGWEREELAIGDAYSAETVAALQRLCALRKGDGELVARELGLCCVGCEWETVGYESVPDNSVTLSAMSDLLLSLKMPTFPPYSVLLNKLAPACSDVPAATTVRIPITRTAP